MEISETSPKSGEGAGLWLLKIVTGALVITLLFVHLIVNHFTAPHGLLDYHDVAVYLSNPWIAFMEESFLVLVVSHSLLGLRSVVLDLNPARTVLQAINWIFALIGVSAVVYGIWLIQVIVSRGTGG